MLIKGGHMGPPLRSRNRRSEYRKAGLKNGNQGADGLDWKMGTGILTDGLGCRGGPMCPPIGCQKSGIGVPDW